MAAIFSQVLNMSMTGSIVILIVIFVRLLLKQSPKIFSYVLWSVVLFRLLCPVAFSAPVSVLDVMQPETKEASENTSIVSYLPDNIDLKVDFVAIPQDSQLTNHTETSEPAEQLIMPPMYAVALVWAAGGIGLILYSIVQYLILRQKLIGAMQVHGNIYLADYIDTAFVVGLLQPKIYLPSNVPENERAYILAHEQHHIRRFDHVFKLLSYLALCIHWFNPVVWIAFVLAGKDMEMSCDEAVIKKLGIEIRADYSASLLRLATRKKILSGMPLAFGEGNTKGRVLNMAKWKKPAKWVAVICTILCICIVVVCAFNPQEERSIEELTHHTSDDPVSTGIGDLHFVYPAGLTSELREVENWTMEEELRHIQKLPNRRQWNNFFIDNGTVFGGVVDFIIPESREIKLEEMNLPPEWTGLDYIATSSNYPYVEMEYTLIKDGKDHIQLYLYTYSGRGYFLWFYTEQGNPVHKKAILASVELGNGIITNTQLKRDEKISLGLFNITIPKGYGYFRNETVILEITKKDLFNNQMILGCVTARPNPGISVDTEEDLLLWIETVGIDLQQEGVSYIINENPPFGDIGVTLKEIRNEKLVMHHTHYCFIAGNTVYDLWIDQLHIDPRIEKALLESIWIKDCAVVPINNMEQVQDDTLTEEETLRQCRAVLEQIQNSGAYKIETARHNGSFALNETAFSTEWGYGNNRLYNCIIPESVGSSTVGGLLVDGKKYYCDSVQSWRETTIWDWRDPWLTSFQWDDAVVAYIGSMTDENGSTVMLRIDQPYTQGEDEQPHYFVDFNFDVDGKFRNVYIQANLFMDNEITERETVISLDPDTINEEILKEYQKATTR